MSGETKERTRKSSDPQGDRLVIDPVCGMELHEPDAGSSVYEGKTYYFCSPDCKEEFDEDPKLYVHNRAGWSE